MLEATLGTTATANCALWVSEPEVPVKVTVVLKTDANVLAEKVNVCGVPGVTVTFNGETVTPVGRLPVSWMLMFESKPLEPVAESEAVVEPPG